MAPDGPGLGRLAGVGVVLCTVEWTACPLGAHNWDCVRTEPHAVVLPLLVRVSLQLMPLIVPRLQLDLSAAALGEGQLAADTVDHGKARVVIGATALGEGQSAAVAVDHAKASVGPQCCCSW